MNRKKSNNLMILAACMALIILTRLVSALPWWSFVVPVLALGALTSVRHWRVSAFLPGFVAGFLVWCGLNIYFDAAGGGLMMEKIGMTLMVPKFIVFLAAGLIGGLLSGLAFYTGRGLLSPQRKLALDEQF